MNKPEHKKYYRDNGELHYETWHLHGELHRADGPAYISYYDSGELYNEEWWLHGKRHRADGPADISYRDSGELYNEEWWLHGKELTREEFISSYEHQNYIADLEIDIILK